MAKYRKKPVVIEAIQLGDKTIDELLELIPGSQDRPTRWLSFPDAASGS